MIPVRTMTVSIMFAAPMISCGGDPTAAGDAERTVEAVLAPCPSSPNCVSSDADDPGHAIGAFGLATDPQTAWGVLREETAKLPRSTVVRDTGGVLHVECASALFGFVDDLELQLRAADGLIAVRSASRTGYSDLGVNRRRVERLRQALQARASSSEVRIL